MRLLATMLLLSAGAVHADTLVVDTLPFKDGTLPYVSSANKAVAAKINAVIYQDVLEMPAPKSLRAGIKNVSEEVNGSLSDMGYEVWRNDGKVLSLKIDGEGCGAYCEDNTWYYNFDAANGDKITTTSIFTPRGLAALNKKLLLLRVARIDKEIARLNQQAKAEKSKKSGYGEDSTFEDAIALYEECRERFADETDNENTHILYSQIRLEKASIVFIRERCSNHAMRALDELDRYENRFKLKDIALYLNAYGSQLLMLKPVK